MSWWSSLFSVFKGGDSKGNIPSPRYDYLEGEEWALLLVMRKIFGEKTWITTVQNTNSMEPLVDVGHRVIINAEPQYLDNLKVGDIIIWELNRGDIIHSIVEIGIDEYGTFYRTQGLNINRKDPEEITKVDIKYVCLGVIWCKGEGYYKEKEGD